MEERLARFEANVEHIQSDVTEIKGDIRRLDNKIDGVDRKLSDKIDGVEQRLSAKIEGVEQRLTVKIDGVKDSVAALTVTMQKAIVKAILWAVACYAALLGTMAHGFHWL